MEFIFRRSEKMWSLDETAEKLDLLQDSQVNPRDQLKNGRSHFHHRPNAEPLPEYLSLKIKDIIDECGRKEIYFGAPKRKLQEVYNNYFERIKLLRSGEVFHILEPDENDQSGSEFNLLLYKGSVGNFLDPDLIVNNFSWIDWDVYVTSKSRFTTNNSSLITINSTRQENNLYKIDVLYRGVLDSPQFREATEPFFISKQDQNLLSGLLKVAQK